jgi:hypothetical protein
MFGRSAIGGRSDGGQPGDHGPTPCIWWKAKDSVATARAARTTRRGQRSWHVQTLLAREPGDLVQNDLLAAPKGAMLLMLP